MNLHRGQSAIDMGLVTRLWLSILSELLYVITDMTVVTV